MGQVSSGWFGLIQVKRIKVSLCKVLSGYMRLFQVVQVILVYVSLCQIRSG
jgi:hypothetical protein